MIDMNLNWAIQHADGTVTAKRNPDGSLNPYHTRESNTKRDSPKTLALQDSKGNTIILIDNIPDGAEVFQRHRQVPVNYNNQFHTVTQTVPAHIDEASGRYVSESSITKTYPEVTYDNLWIIGYRIRNGGAVNVYFKVLYPDGLIEEYNDWGVKPWLFPVELFAEELLDADDMDSEIERLTAEYNVSEVATPVQGKMQAKGLNAKTDAKNALLNQQKSHVDAIKAEYAKRFNV
jgi:hypothetical protein